MSLYNKQINIGSMEHDEFVYREENLKQTIQDFTKELKERIKKTTNWFEIFEEIDKLNQKHYGKGLIKEKLK